ncbi:MAG: EpsG family protein [Clostridia bacterium]|nr:EpsG family protein [Clostridia bacterium]
MVPFIIMLTVPIIISPFTDRLRINKVSLEKFSLFIFFLFMTVLVMFRNRGIGNDTNNYMNFFEQTARTTGLHLDQKSALELGFQLLMKVVAVFTRDPHVFIAVTGLMVSAMLYPTYRRLCVDTPLTIVLFCTMSTFLMLFSGIRQMLALGIGMIAYEFTRRKWIVPFLIAVVAAVFIHTSAFILILMYPLYHLRVTKKWLFAVVPVLGLIFVFNRQIFGFLGRFIEEYTNYDASTVATGAYTMLILFILFTVFSFLIPDDSMMDEETFALRNFLLISLAIQMFTPLNFLVMRMSYYYIIFIPLLLPRIIQCSRIKYRKIALVGRYVMLAFFYVYFFISISGGSKMHIVPYRFFWESM